MPGFPGRPFRFVSACGTQMPRSHFSSPIQALIPARIVVWGSSLGGGNAVELAADHPELAGVIAQVPMLDGRAAVLAVPALRLMRFAFCSLIDLIKPGRPVYIPVVSKPGAFSSMDREMPIRHCNWLSAVWGASMITVSLRAP